MSGYDYGNARLRARATALLRHEHYAGLLGRDGPALLAGLAATSYAPQAESMPPAAREQPAALDQMVHDHLIAGLTGIAGFYRDRAREVVTALLGRYDVHNVLTLLRAQHRSAAPQLALERLVPVGAIGTAAAAAAAAQPDLPAAAQLLAAQRLPDPGSAAALRAAARRYEVDNDLAAAEQAITCSAWDHQRTTLASAGRVATETLAALRRETDDRNLLLALRIREAASRHEHGAAAGSPQLPAGTVPERLLAAIRGAPGRADVVATAAAALRDWRDPLAAWAAGGPLAGLQADLETARLRTAGRRLRRADPLGAAPVLHYLLAHQAQARNVRLLAQAAAGVISDAEAHRHLVVPE